MILTKLTFYLLVKDGNHVLQVLLCYLLDSLNNAKRKFALFFRAFIKWLQCLKFDNISYYVVNPILFM
jgi:hypothetical protein